MSDLFFDQVNCLLYYYDWFVEDFLICGTPCVENCCCDYGASNLLGGASSYDRLQGFQHVLAVLHYSVVLSPSAYLLPDFFGIFSCASNSCKYTIYRRSVYVYRPQGWPTKLDCKID